MMKRGIGVVVLAVIAALLLVYLLKGKSTERQEVVDMKLPGAPEMNIPSLSEAGDAVTSLAGNATDTVSNAGTVIVASAAGAGTAIVGAAKATGDKAAAIIVSSDNTKDSQNPGFSIRPSQTGEQREFVDNTVNTKKQQKANKVVAKAVKKEKTYKPRIIEEKKKKVVKKSKPKKAPAKVVKKDVQKPAKQKAAAKQSKPKTTAKQVAKQSKPKAAAKAVAAASIASTAPAGKYTIQLLATSSSTRASKLSKVLKSEGYTTYITETNNNNKVLYRVRVGGYGNRNKAIQAQASMKRRYQKNFFVQNSLVVSR